MASIIDELIVTLGLDASKFQQGAQEVDKGRKQISASAKQMQDSLDGVERSMLKLVGVFAGFAGAAGFVNWVGGLIKATAELGRLQETLGTTARDLYAWRQIGAQVGATADDITGSYQRMNEALNEYLTGSGNLNAYFRYFWGKGVQLFTGEGANRRPNDQTTIYTQALDVMRRENMDPQRAATFARGIGMSQGTFQALWQYRDNPAQLQRDLERQRREAPSADDIKRSAEAQKEYNKALTEFDRVGRSLGVTGLPMLTEVFRQLNKTLDTTSGEVKAIKEKFDQFSKWLENSWLGKLLNKAFAPYRSGPGGYDGASGFGAGGGPGVFRPGIGPGARSRTGGADSDAAVAKLADIKSNSAVADMRASRIAEINSDPQLKAHVLKMAELEESGPYGRTGAIESLINRSIMTGDSIRQELDLGFYSTRGRFGQPMGGSSQKMSQAALDVVAKGSNLIQGRTDQGMVGDPNWQGPGKVKVPGTSGIFNYWRGRRLGREFTHEDSRRFAENMNRRAAEADAAHPTTAGMPGPSGSSSGATPQKQRGGWRSWLGMGNTGNDPGYGGDAWGQNVRAIPWLQNGGMSVIKGIPAPVSNRSSTSETHIGSFTVNTEPRSNPYSMAAQIKDAVQRSNIMNSANWGPN